ncbi:L-glutamine ABC transporter membrane protein /L-glutamate ABC transporter membrane protein /L-aspartate ABC transporter membrane protein /L-asparagine ABC transporter membrane protein [Maritimibacter alkaliphilus HTCC2654]|uniref:Glutamate/glutamine/aspartate/asparagine ABC transporter, permease protein n=1 Tax=Maritimibacter alkaliphilus HTCC2654 TaxID=314271 RepID=A3VF94_9RHOB|nr:amino acid ABC transporter permease [Maritimibacter alkaliphilus]EAQ13009.1 glutamate/glutamine/aspartate/asparagine ABC transporter, permease protein [Rhodobacterales bacterium HTCC2654] [Maritimibacter alkaliphilus HTCC2654]TYP79943.1 L-glutamine ABC transporter membrane protein /L-glutamate ABC transporter membrane protein /L-aspartate ABC transporter membrane protein /L-asparagine ABC transporter membrane protein [Maritimibacter alkaliphilus HTCC2654]
MEDLSYVRTDMLPERDPPASEVGVIGWLRMNLFSGWFNSILTVIALAFIYLVLAAIIPWLWSPTWGAGSLSACREIIAELGKEHGGACYGVITERWQQLLFGFYPEELRWRPILTFIGLFVALAPVLFNETFPGKMLWFTGAFLFLAPWLMWGGPIWTPLLVAAGPALGFVAYRYLVSVIGNLASVIVAVLIPVLFWLFLVGPLSQAIDGVVPLGIEVVESRLFGGFMLSVWIGVVAIAISLVLGVILALGRQSDLLIVKYLSVGFIEFIRGVPLITLLFVASTLLNIFMPPGTNFDIILRVMIMATLFASAYIAEVIRGGLAALPRGQYEAADALGLDYWKAQRLIILPQALKISIPGIVSTFIGLFKDTTLVSIIGLLDPIGLTGSIRADANWNGIVWELYGFIALLFFISCFSMSRYSMWLEKKLRTDHR